MSTTTPDRLSERLSAAFPGFELPAELVQIATALDAPDLDDMFGTYEVAKRLSIEEETVRKVSRLLDRPDAGVLRYLGETNAWDLEEPEPVEEAAETAVEAPVDPPKVEVPAELPKAVQAPTAPVWEWDGTKPLDTAREWETAMLSCTHIGPAAKNLASLYRAVGHMTEGEGYVGVEYATTVLGCNVRNLKKRRSELTEFGWLVDTGRTTGHPWHLPIFEFRMGYCGCCAPELKR